MREDQIEHMVRRFREFQFPWSVNAESTTDLHGYDFFDDEKARDMVRFMVEGLPAEAALPEPVVDLPFNHPVDDLKREAKWPAPSPITGKGRPRRK